MKAQHNITKSCQILFKIYLHFIKTGKKAFLEVWRRYIDFVCYIQAACFQFPYIICSMSGEVYNIQFLLLIQDTHKLEILTCLLVLHKCLQKQVPYWFQLWFLQNCESIFWQHNYFCGCVSSAWESTTQAATSMFTM